MSRRDAGTKRTQARSEETRRLLLNAAIAAFAERGYEGATTRNIADRAGVHHPLINYHFANKRGLWESAADEVFDALHASIDEDLGRRDGDAAAQFAAAVQAITVHTAENPQWYRFLDEASAADGERAEWLSRRHVGRLFDRLIPLVESAQYRGLIAGDDPVRASLGILGAMGSVVSLVREYARLTGKDLVGNGRSDAYARQLASLLMHGAESGRR